MPIEKTWYWEGLFLKLIWTVKISSNLWIKISLLKGQICGHLRWISLYRYMLTNLQTSNDNDKTEIQSPDVHLSYNDYHFSWLKIDSHCTGNGLCTRQCTRIRQIFREPLLQVNPLVIFLKTGSWFSVHELENWILLDQWLVLRQREPSQPRGFTPLLWLKVILVCLSLVVFVTKITTKSKKIIKHSITVIWYL